MSPRSPFANPQKDADLVSVASGSTRKLEGDQNSYTSIDPQALMERVATLEDALLNSSDVNAALTEKLVQLEAAVTSLSGIVVEKDDQGRQMLSKIDELGEVRWH
jgi:hypothetical protein